MGPGLMLVIAIYAIVIATAIFAGIFHRKISGGYASILDILKSAFSWLKLFLNPRFLITLALVLIGLGLIVSSYTVRAWQIEDIYYRYRLEEHPVYMGRPIPEYIIYRLVEQPMKITRTFYDAFFEPNKFFIGAALILAAMLLTAYWLAKANNVVYGVKKFPWEE